MFVGVGGAPYWSRLMAGRGVVMSWGYGGEAWRDYWSSHERLGLILKGSSRMERLANYRLLMAPFPAELLAPQCRIDGRRRVVELLEQSDRELAAARPRDRRLDLLYIRERLRR